MRCALCDRSTSGTVFCTVHVGGYENSPEYRRELYFRSAGNEDGARAAVRDYVWTTLKTQQVDYERTRNEQSKETAKPA